MGILCQKSTSLWLGWLSRHSLILLQIVVWRISFWEKGLVGSLFFLLDFKLDIPDTMIHKVECKIKDPLGISSISSVPGTHIARQEIASSKKDRAYWSENKCFGRRLLILQLLLIIVHFLIPTIKVKVTTKMENICLPSHVICILLFRYWPTVFIIHFQ